MVEKWEYMTVGEDCGEYWDALTELNLKSLGEEGWEVFHVTERKSETPGMVFLKAYLKRRVIGAEIIAYNGTAISHPMQTSIADQIEGGVHQRVD